MPVVLVLVASGFVLVLRYGAIDPLAMLADLARSSMTMIRLREVQVHRASLHLRTLGAGALTSVAIVFWACQLIPAHVREPILDVRLERIAVVVAVVWLSPFAVLALRALRWRVLDGLPLQLASPATLISYGIVPVYLVLAWQHVHVEWLAHLLHVRAVEVALVVMLALGVPIGLGLRRLSTLSLGGHTSTPSSATSSTYGAYRTDAALVRSN